MSRRLCTSTVLYAILGLLAPTPVTADNSVLCQTQANDFCYKHQMAPMPRPPPPPPPSACRLGLSVNASWSLQEGGIAWRVHEPKAIQADVLDCITSLICACGIAQPMSHLILSVCTVVAVQVHHTAVPV